MYLKEIKNRAPCDLPVDKRARVDLITGMYDTKINVISALVQPLGPHLSQL